LQQPGNFSPHTSTAHYQILEIRGSGCGKNETPAAMMMEGLRKSRRLFRFLHFEMVAYIEVELTKIDQDGDLELAA
jgi:hypothetical protein